MKYGNAKAIDWQLAVQLANNKPDLAQELLELLVTELPQARSGINHAFENSDFTSLQQHVHRLHGAACYCGVPRLKQTAAQLESKLRALDQANNDALPSIQALIINLNHEVDQILTSFKRQDYEPE